MTAILYRSQVAICVLLLSVAAADGQQRPVVRDRIQREARAFELDEVRLRDSPFKRAMMLDAGAFWADWERSRRVPCVWAKAKELVVEPVRVRK